MTLRQIELDTYMKAADFMATHPEACNVRPFNSLRLLVILNLQCRLRRLEKKVHLLSIEGELRSALNIEDNESLSKVMVDLQHTLQSYDEFCGAQERIGKLPVLHDKHVVDFTQLIASRFSILLGDLDKKGLDSNGVNTHNLDTIIASQFPDLRNDLEAKNIDPSRLYPIINSIFSSSLNAKGTTPYSFDTLVVLNPKRKTWIHGFIDEHKFLNRHLAKYFECNSSPMACLIASSILCVLLLCTFIMLSDGITLGKLVIVLGIIWPLVLVLILLCAIPVSKPLIKRGQPCVDPMAVADVTPVSKSDEIYHHVYGGKMPSVKSHMQNQWIYMGFRRFFRWATLKLRPQPLNDEEKLVYIE